MKGVAPEDPEKAARGAFEDALLLYRFQHIR